jgi:hypothetical protein
MPVAITQFPFLLKSNSQQSSFVAEIFSNVNNYAFVISNTDKNFSIPPFATSLKVTIDDSLHSGSDMISLIIPVSKCLVDNQIIFEIVPQINDNKDPLGDALVNVGFTSNEVKALNKFYTNMLSNGNKIESNLAQGVSYTVKMNLTVNGVAYFHDPLNRPTITHNDFAPDFAVNSSTNPVSDFNITQTPGYTNFIVSGLVINNPPHFGDSPQSMTVTFDELDVDNSNNEETYEAVLNMDPANDGIVNFEGSSMLPYDIITMEPFFQYNNSGIYLIQTLLIQGGFKVNSGYVISCSANYGNNITVTPYTRVGQRAWNLKPVLINHVSFYDASPPLGVLASQSTQKLLTVTLASTDPNNSSLPYWGDYKPDSVNFILEATVGSVNQRFETANITYLSANANTHADMSYTIDLKDMVPDGSYTLSNGIIYTLSVKVNWDTAPLIAATPPATGQIPNPIWPVGESRTSLNWSNSDVIFHQGIDPLTNLLQYNAWEALTMENPELVTDSMPERGVILSFKKNDLFNANGEDNLDVSSTKFHVQYSVSTFGGDGHLTQSEWTDVINGGIAQASGTEQGVAANIKQGAAAALAAYNASTPLVDGLFPLPTPPVPSVLGSNQPPLYVYVPNVDSIFNENLTSVVNFRVSIKTSQSNYLPLESDFTAPGSLYIVNKPDVYSWAVPSNISLEPYMDFDSNHLVLPMDDSSSNSIYYKHAIVSWTSNDAINPLPATLGEGPNPSFNVILGQTVSYKVTYVYNNPNSVVPSSTFSGKQSALYSAVCKGLPSLADYAVTNNNLQYVYDNVKDELVFDLNISSASEDRRIDGVELFIEYPDPDLLVPVPGIKELSLKAFYASTYVSGKQTVALAPLLSAANVSLVRGSKYTLVFKPFRDRRVSTVVDDMSNINEKYGLASSILQYEFIYIAQAALPAAPNFNDNVVGYSWTVSANNDNMPYMSFGSQLQLVIPMNIDQAPHYKDATITWVSNGPTPVVPNNVSENVVGNLPAFNVVAGTTITYKVTYNYHAIDGSVFPGQISELYTAVCLDSPKQSDYSVTDYSFTTFNNNKLPNGKSTISFKISENVSSTDRMDGVDVYFQPSQTSPAIPSILIERYSLSDLSGANPALRTLTLVNPAGADGKTYILQLVVDSNGNPVLDVDGNHTYVQTSYVWNNKTAGVISFVGYRDHRVSPYTPALYTNYAVSRYTPAPPPPGTGPGNVVNIPFLPKPSNLHNHSGGMGPVIGGLLAGGLLAGAAGSGGSSSSSSSSSSSNGDSSNNDPDEEEQNSWGGVEGITLTSGIIGQDIYLMWKPPFGAVVDGEESNVTYSVTLSNGVEQDVGYLDFDVNQPYCKLKGVDSVMEYTINLMNTCEVDGIPEESEPNVIIFTAARVVTTVMIVTVDPKSTDESLTVSWLPPVKEGTSLITSTKLTNNGTNVSSSPTPYKESSPKTYDISSLSLGEIMKLKMAVRARINYTIDGVLCPTYATRLSLGHETDYALSTIPSVSLSSSTSTVLMQGNSSSTPTLLLELNANGLEAEGFISLVVILTQDGTPDKPGGTEVLLQFPLNPSSSNPFLFPGKVESVGSNLTAGNSYSVIPLNLSPTGLSNSLDPSGNYTLKIGNVLTSGVDSGRYSLSFLTFPANSGFVDDKEANIMAILTTRRGTDIMVGSFNYVTPAEVSQISISQANGNYYVNFTLG